MKYGFAIVSMVGVGELYWDEYYEDPVIRKVRLFDTEKERDNAAKIEDKRRYNKYRKNGKPFGTYEICKFVTK